MPISAAIALRRWFHLEAFFLLLSARLHQSTGQIIAVDGGLREAFLR